MLSRIKTLSFDNNMAEPIVSRPVPERDGARHAETELKQVMWKDAGSPRSVVTVQRGFRGEAH